VGRSHIGVASVEYAAMFGGGFGTAGVNFASAGHFCVLHYFIPVVFVACYLRFDLLFSLVILHPSANSLALQIQDLSMQLSTFTQFQHLLRPLQQLHLRSQPLPLPPTPRTRHSLPPLQQLHLHSPLLPLPPTPRTRHSLPRPRLHHLFSPFSSHLLRPFRYGSMQAQQSPLATSLECWSWCSSCQSTARRCPRSSKPALTSFK